MIRSSMRLPQGQMAELGCDRANQLRPAAPSLVAVRTRPAFRALAGAPTETHVTNIDDSRPTYPPRPELPAAGLVIFLDLLVLAHLVLPDGTTPTVVVALDDDCRIVAAVTGTRGPWATANAVKRLLAQLAASARSPSTIEMDHGLDWADREIPRAAREHGCTLVWLPAAPLKKRAAGRERALHVLSRLITDELPARPASEERRVTNVAQLDALLLTTVAPARA